MQFVRVTPNGNECVPTKEACIEMHSLNSIRIDSNAWIVKNLSIFSVRKFLSYCPRSLNATQIQSIAYYIIMGRASVIKTSNKQQTICSTNRTNLLLCIRLYYSHIHGTFFFTTEHYYVWERDKQRRRRKGKYFQLWVHDLRLVAVAQLSHTHELICVT